MNDWRSAKSGISVIKIEWATATFHFCLLQLSAIWCFLVIYSEERWWRPRMFFERKSSPFVLLLVWVLVVSVLGPSDVTALIYSLKNVGSHYVTPQPPGVFKLPYHLWLIGLMEKFYQSIDVMYVQFCKEMSYITETSYHNYFIFCMTWQAKLICQ